MFIITVKTTSYIFSNQGRYHEAEDLLQEAVRMDPYSSDVYTSLALTMDMLDNHHGAMQMFQKAIDFNPGCAKLRAQFITLLIKIGELLLKNFFSGFSTKAVILLL